MSNREPGFRRAVGAVLTVAALALPPAAAAPAASPVPEPPYYSVQLDSAPTRAQALARLQDFKDAPHARAEARRTGWLIRAGAWKDRAAADAAVVQFRERGAKDARVLSLHNPVAWLLPDGTTLPLGGAATVAPAPAAATPAAPVPTAPATTTTTAARKGPTFLAPPPVPPARPVATGLDVPADYRTAAQKLDVEMRRWLRDQGPLRRDGALYTMDVAPLLLYAAHRADQALYLQLLAEARKLIVNDPRDSYTHGFVLWRAKAGQPPEITGTTEAQWLARALWQGAAAFNRREDRTLALTVLDGYARHAYELQGVWLVRKYFAFDGRAFANLSSVHNYHADLMSDLEAQAPRSTWQGFAERSYAVLERMRSPAGLLYPILQPEIGATYPDLGVAAYAPNAIASLSDACFGAAGAVRGRPQLADALLDFTRDRDRRTRGGRLYAYFRTDTGERMGPHELSSTGYACLGGLAAARNDRGAFKRLLPWLLLSMNDIANVPSVQMAPLHEGGQLLLTAYAAGAFNP